MSNAYINKLTQLGFVWCLNEVSGSTWVDAIGNHNGTINNATVETDPVEVQDAGFPTNAASFVDGDGIDANAQHVRVPHHTDLNSANAITIAGWLWAQAWGTGEGPSDENSWLSWISKGNNGWEIRRSGSSVLRATMRIDPRPQSSSVVSLPSPNGRLDVPRLIVFTFDGTNVRVFGSVGSTMTQHLSDSRPGSLTASTEDVGILAQIDQGTARRFLPGRVALPSMAPVSITLAEAQEMYDAAYDESEPEPGIEVPSNFSFVANDRTLTGSWDAVTGADHYEYEIERNDSGTWVSFESGTVTGTSFNRDETDGVDWSNTYRARVRTAELDS